MRPKVFFPIVIAIYLAAPYFFYKYVSFTAEKEDAIKVETGIVGNQVANNGLEVNESDIIDQQEVNLTLQSYGYLGGGVFSILCPTLLLIFRHRILT